MSESESESCSVVSNSLRLHGLYSPWNSPGQNTGVGGLSLLQGIFPTQGSNPGLPQCRRILYQLSQQGSPRILEWVVYPFSSRSSQTRNTTGVSCIAGRFFTQLSGKPPGNLNLEASGIWFWRRQWHPTPVLLPGKSHGRRSLGGHSPWGCEESDTTLQFHFHFSLSCTGEGNGNPLQCSCLENPRDGGAWWAAVYGVVQSWTRLKWLSSSRDLITELPQDLGNRLLKGTNKTLCTPGARRKEQYPHKRLNQTSCECPGASGGVMGQQIGLRPNNREGTQPHPWTEYWIKDLLSTAPPIRTRPSSPYSQSLSSWSFHKLLILIHQRVDRKKTNHRKLTELLTSTTALSNSVKLWAMPHRATQDGQVIVETSDETWSTGEGNGKPLQHSCLENPMNSMKRQKDMTVKQTPQVGRFPVCHWRKMEK